MDRVVEQLRQYYLREENLDYSAEIIKTAFADWYERRTAEMLDNAVDLLTTPHLSEAKEFARVLERRAAEDAERDAAFAAELFQEAKADQFTGFRPYSPERVAAVIQYLAHRCKDLYATKLNKLLFYSDFSYFALMKLGLTGGHYVKLTHGPIFDKYDAMLSELERKGEVRIRRFDAKGKEGKQILPPAGYRPDRSILDEGQRKLLDWVIKTYGAKSTAEIVAASHQESAYWDTNYQQPIDYNYAATLRKQPPKELVR